MDVDVPQPAAEPLPAPPQTQQTGPLSVEPYLRALVEVGGSDLHCKTGSPPRVRIDGRLRKLQAPTLTATDTEHMVGEVLRDRPDLWQEFLRDERGGLRVLDARRRPLPRQRLPGARLGRAGVPPRLGRCHRARGPRTAAGGRSALAMEPRGLVLVTGPTGSGKTTTLAGMIDEINNNREVHVVTIEDPIEVLHYDKLSMINQREVKLDTADFHTALRAAMRQDPDVILVGEMRDSETVKAALAAAETGHFVLSTLHTTDAAETVNRIIDFFPPHEQKQIRHDAGGVAARDPVPATGSARGRVRAAASRWRSWSTPAGSPTRSPTRRRPARSPS